MGLFTDHDHDDQPCGCKGGAARLTDGMPQDPAAIALAAAREVGQEMAAQVTGPLSEFVALQRDALPVREVPSDRFHGQSRLLNPGETVSVPANLDRLRLTICPLDPSGGEGGIVNVVITDKHPGEVNPAAPGALAALGAVLAVTPFATPYVFHTRAAVYLTNANADAPCYVGLIQEFADPT